MTAQELETGRGIRSAALMALRLLGLFLLALSMLRLGWISDDALITLRSALNAAHGWGPQFNPVESVQSYTHPLWFFMWTGLGVVTGSWIPSILILGVVLSVLASGLIIWMARSWWMIIIAIGLLFGSNAFMEYATSGLENPLSYLTIGVLFMMVRAVWISAPRQVPAWQAVLFGLTLAATFLTRMDLVLLLLPPVIGVLVVVRRSVRTLTLMGAATLVPVLAYFTWAWMQYSTLLPNTFAAKRNVDIPLGEMLSQGVTYVSFSARWDLVTGMVLLLAVIAGTSLGSTLQRLWVIGLVVYLLYVITNGGDFMAGRFLAVPAYVAVAVIVSMEDRWSSLLGSLRHRLYPHQKQVLVGAIALLLVLVGAVVALVWLQRTPTAWSAPSSGRWNYEDMSYSHGIADERGVWVGWADRSIYDLGSDPGPSREVPELLIDLDVTAPLSGLERSASEWPDRDGQSAEPERVDMAPTVLGTMGIQVGPKFHIVDIAALADRFLAEQTFTVTNDNWLVGHYFRSLPEGYVDAIRSGDPTLLTDDQLADDLEELWQSIRVGYGS